MVFPVAMPCDFHHVMRSFVTAHWRNGLRGFRVTGGQREKQKVKLGRFRRLKGCISTVGTLGHMVFYIFHVPLIPTTYLQLLQFVTPKSESPAL